MKGLAWVPEQVHTFREVVGALRNRDSSLLTKYKDEKEGLKESCRNHRKMNRILHERLLQMENEIEDKTLAMVRVPMLVLGCLKCSVFVGKLPALSYSINASCVKNLYIAGEDP